MIIDLINRALGGAGDIVGNLRAQPDAALTAILLLIAAAIAGIAIFGSPWLKGWVMAYTTIP